MTNRQKAALAREVLDRVGVITEFWGERPIEGLEGVSLEEAASQLATWLQHLPGHSWRTDWPTPAELKQSRSKLKRTP